MGEPAHPPREEPVPLGKPLLHPQIAAAGVVIAGSQLGVGHRCQEGDRPVDDEGDQKRRPRHTGGDAGQNEDPRPDMAPTRSWWRPGGSSPGVSRISVRNLPIERDASRSLFLLWNTPAVIRILVRMMTLTVYTMKSRSRGFGGNGKGCQNGGGQSPGVHEEDGPRSAGSLPDRRSTTRRSGSA